MDDQLVEHRTAEDIGQIRRRIEAVVKNRPEFGKETDVSIARLTDGLACVTSEKSWTFECDMPDMAGGRNTGPTPGVLLRAALGSCLAMGYKIRACLLGIELTSVTVTVSSDSALAGMVDLESDYRPGYSEIRYHVEIESSASESDIHRVINDADQLSPILDAFSNHNTARRTFELRRPTSSEG